MIPVAAMSYRWLPVVLFAQEEDSSEERTSVRV